MSESATTADSPACPNCAALQQRIAELETRLAKLEKNSTNSSKPPSSDFVSPQGFSVFQNTEHTQEFPGLIGEITEGGGDVAAILSAEEV